jgi:hypothetical protein
MRTEREIRERLDILNSVYWRDTEENRKDVYLALKQLAWVLEETWPYRKERFTTLSEFEKT